MLNAMIRGIAVIITGLLVARKLAGTLLTRHHATRRSLQEAIAAPSTESPRLRAASGWSQTARLAASGSPPERGRDGRRSIQARAVARTAARRNSIGLRSRDPHRNAGSRGWQHCQ